MGFSIISDQSCEYTLVLNQDTNIPCDFGRCFEGTIFGSVTLRNLGSKREPCKHRARPDHACHSSYSQNFIPWTGFPTNKMASCDCLKIAFCDQFAHKKKLHAYVKFCMYKRNVFMAGGFCLCDHQRSNWPVPFKTRLPV